MGVGGQLIGTRSAHVTTMNTLVCRNAVSVRRCSRRNKTRNQEIIHLWDKEGPRPVCYERSDGCRTACPGPYPEANLQGRCVHDGGGGVCKWQGTLVNSTSTVHRWRGAQGRARQHIQQYSTVRHADSTCYVTDSYLCAFSQLLVSVASYRLACLNTPTHKHTHTHL